MVRENGGKEKQDSVATTKTFGCEQRPRRSERSPSQPKNGYGGARRRQGPTLDDYYEPSDEMKDYMNVVTDVIGSVSGYLVTKIL